MNTAMASLALTTSALGGRSQADAAGPVHMIHDGEDDRLLGSTKREFDFALEHLWKAHTENRPGVLFVGINPEFSMSVRRTKLEQRKAEPPAATPGPVLVMPKPLEPPTEEEIQSTMNCFREGDREQFTSYLEAARYAWRRFPKLVEADKLDLPEQFLDAYRSEHKQDPDDDRGFMGDNVFDPDYEVQLRQHAIDYLLRMRERERARKAKA